MNHTRVLEHLGPAAERGVGAAVIFDGGFGEAGDDGRRRQNELTTICREAGIALCGPNCMGVVSPHAKSLVYLQGVHDPAPLAGNVGLVSQSGSICIGLLADCRRYGWSHVISSGNEAVLPAVDFLEYLNRQVGITTVYVTHDQTEAMTMSDRVVVMNRGRVEQAAAPLEVYRRPATRFVAEFVGNSNLLEGRVLDPGRIALPTLGVTAEVAGLSALPAGPVDVLIRPERIRVLARTQGGAIAMKVARVTHFGDSVLITGTAGTQPLRVRLSSALAVDVREGEEILVAWGAADLHLIATRPGEPGVRGLSQTLDRAP